jgi:hypothetical protein
MSLILQATQPALSAWTPDALIRVIAELMVAALAVIGAWKGIRADGKTDVLRDRTNSLANHLQSVDSQATRIALAVSPTGTGDGGPTSSERPVVVHPSGLSGIVNPTYTYPGDQRKP